MTDDLRIFILQILIEENPYRLSKIIQDRNILYEVIAINISEIIYEGVNDIDQLVEDQLFMEFGKENIYPDKLDRCKTRITYIWKSDELNSSFL